MGKVTFLNPEFFWLFLLIPVAIAWLFLKRNQQMATLKMKIPSAICLNQLAEGVFFVYKA